MRFNLPGYDINYRDSRDHDTPAGKKLEELNRFLMKNGIKGGIACLDEKGKVVTRYTDRVALEIDDSTPPEKIEEVKKMVLELLRVMGATESQLESVFKDKKDKEGEISLEKWTIFKGNWRFELPGYDTNYRDSRDHDTPAGKKLKELNRFLMKNGIKGGIACLDEKGEVVTHYTDHVVFEIDGSVSQEKLEEAKKMVSELLRIMRAAKSNN